VLLTIPTPPRDQGSCLEVHSGPFFPFSDPKSRSDVCRLDAPRYTTGIYLFPGRHSEVCLCRGLSTCFLSVKTIFCLITSGLVSFLARQLDLYMVTYFVVVVPPLSAFFVCPSLTLFWTSTLALSCFLSSCGGAFILCIYTTGPCFKGLPPQILSRSILSAEEAGGPFLSHTDI